MWLLDLEPPEFRRLPVAVAGGAATRFIRRTAPLSTVSGILPYDRIKFAFSGVSGVSPRITTNSD
jgi:hypothetical protein